MKALALATIAIAIGFTSVKLRTCRKPSRYTRHRYMGQPQVLYDHPL